MARPKGIPKTGGRQKGTLNRTTREARELLEKIIYSQFDGIEDVLKEIKNDDKSKYIMALDKMLQYVLAKKTDVTTDDKPIQANLNVTVDNSETAETLKRLRDELANRG